MIALTQAELAQCYVAACDVMNLPMKAIPPVYVELAAACSRQTIKAYCKKNNLPDPYPDPPLQDLTR